MQWQQRFIALRKTFLYRLLHSHHIVPLRAIIAPISRMLTRTPCGGPSLKIVLVKYRATPMISIIMPIATSLPGVILIHYSVVEVFIIVVCDYLLIPPRIPRATTLFGIMANLDPKGDLSVQAMQIFDSDSTFVVLFSTICL